MGCIGSHLSQLITSSSTLDREVHLTRRRSIFPVLNVDELGRHFSPGKLEVTESDLVLHINGKPSLTWPLRWLRRYGYDNDLFSFEAGRRCPTGAGIYAFKCSHAQTLFELLQAKIQGNPHALPLIPSHPLPPTTPAQTAQGTHISPLSMSPTFDYVNISENQQRNNNFGAEDPPEPLEVGENGHPLYMNVDSQPAAPSVQSMANGNVRRHRKLGNGSTPSAPLLYHNNELSFERTGPPASVLYTNVNCSPKAPGLSPESSIRPEVNYAELDLEQSLENSRSRSRSEMDRSVLRLKSTRSYGSDPLSPPSPTHTLIVTKTSVTSATTSTTTSSFGDPTLSDPRGELVGTEAGKLGYATIDFDRTAALSVVTRAKIKLDFHSSSTEREEESEEVSTSLTTTTTAIRKTRHNSTAL